MNKIMNFLNISNYSSVAQKQFLFNLFLGVMVLLFFIIIKDTAVIQSSINGWLDYYIMLRMDSETETQMAAQNVTFLDFDNKSFQILGGKSYRRTVDINAERPAVLTTPQVFVR